MPRIGYISTNGPGGAAQHGIGQLGREASDYGYVEIGSDGLNKPGSFPFRVDQNGNVTAANVSGISVGLQPSGDTSGVTDTAAIAALITAGASTIALAPGAFYTHSSGVAITSVVQIIGAGSSATSITNANGHVFNFTGNTFIRGSMRFQGITVNATGGDCFHNINGQGWIWEDVQMVQNSAGNYCVLVQNPGSYIGMTHINVQHKVYGNPRSVPACSYTSNISMGIQGNTWIDSGWNNFQYDNTQCLVLISTTGGSEHVQGNNSFYNSGCTHAFGGWIKALSHYNLVVDGAMSFDTEPNLGSTFGASIIYVGTNTGDRYSAGTSIRNFYRDQNGPSGDGNTFWDLEFDVNNSAVLVENCGARNVNTFAQSFAVNFHGCNDATIIAGQTPTTENSSTTLTISNPPTNLLQMNGGVITPAPQSLVPALIPSDRNYKAWSFAPEMIQSGTGALVSQTVYLVKIRIPVAVTATNIVLGVNGAGSGLTGSQSYAGIYNSSGTLLYSTADQSASWNSTGLKSIALTGGPYTLPAGTYYVAILSGGTTPPGFARGAGQATGGVTATTLNPGSISTATYMTNATAQASLPGTVTISAGAQYGNAVWVAIT